MAWKVIVLKEVVRRIGACGLSRNAVVRLLTGLYMDLPQSANTLRVGRDPSDPDRFLCEVVAVEGGRRHRCVFHVNDARATDHLFVEWMTHRADPIP